MIKTGLCSELDVSKRRECELLPLYDHVHCIHESPVVSLFSTVLPTNLFRKGSIYLNRNPLIDLRLRELAV